MTCNDIEVLIHCHVFPEPHPRKDTPAVQTALNMLETHGLIEEDTNKTNVYLLPLEEQLT